MGRKGAGTRGRWGWGEGRTATSRGVRYTGWNSPEGFSSSGISGVSAASLPALRASVSTACEVALTATLSYLRSTPGAQTGPRSGADPVQDSLGRGEARSGRANANGEEETAGRT